MDKKMSSRLLVIGSLVLHLKMIQFFSSPTFSYFCVFIEQFFEYFIKQFL